MKEKLKEKEIGVISGYFVHVGVAAIKLSGKLALGERVHIKGSTTDFEQEVDSIQINNKDISEAKKGDHIGIKVIEKVRPNDKIFLLE
jgi:translation elongation factor EF-1alpha